MNENKFYEDRVVAFIDILGFKNIIEKTHNGDHELFNKVIDCLDLLRSEFLNENKPEIRKIVEDIYTESDPENYPDYNIQVHQISDCIIISSLSKPKGSVINIICKISLMIHILIKNGFLCRGSITMGKVYHTRDHLLGKAYIESYLNEQKERFPVISFSKDILDYALENPTDNISEFKFVENFVKPHIEGKYFIDYFNDLPGNIDVFESPKEHYNKLRNIIIEGYKSKDYGIKLKYLWMIDLFNSSEIVKEKILKKIVK